MKIYDICIFEIPIHFYPSLLEELAKISLEILVKNYGIFGKTNLPRYNLKTPSPNPMTSFANYPIGYPVFYPRNFCLRARLKSHARVTIGYLLMFKQILYLHKALRHPIVARRGIQHQIFTQCGTIIAQTSYLTEMNGK